MTQYESLRQSEYRKFIEEVPLPPLDQLKWCYVRYPPGRFGSTRPDLTGVSFFHERDLVVTPDEELRQIHSLVASGLCSDCGITFELEVEHNDAAMIVTRMVHVTARPPCPGCSS